jgi:hypothetical protein
MSKYRLEVRPNDDGSIDEVVLYDSDDKCVFHLEQLDDDLWYFDLTTDTDHTENYEIFDIFRTKKKVHVRQQ